MKRFPAKMISERSSSLRFARFCEKQILSFGNSIYFLAPVGIVIVSLFHFDVSEFLELTDEELERVCSAQLLDPFSSSNDVILPFV